jgi:hypothetical protein
MAMGLMIAGVLLIMASLVAFALRVNKLWVDAEL